MHVRSKLLAGNRLRRFAAAAVLAAGALGMSSGAAVLAVTTAPAAQAEPTTRLPAQILDNAGVLNAGDRVAVQRALDRLYSDHQIQLWVVYVKDFDGKSAEQWTRATAVASDLGERDVLLAVATGDGRTPGSGSYYLDAPSGVDGLSNRELSSISTHDLVPQLRDHRWAPAAVATADGISAAMDPSYTGWIVGGALGAVAIVGGGGAVLYRRRRADNATAAAIEALRDSDEELTADQLSAQPLNVLDPWSKEVLTDTDNAVATSAEELALAVDEFGDAETAPFRAAVDQARAGLAKCFALRQRIDDDIPETADERRSMLVEIIVTCTDLDSALDEQVSGFDEMRNLLINADTRLSELTREIVAAQARLATAGPVLTQLIAEHGANALQSIAHNVELAAEQIEFADDSADQGREAISAPVGHQGPAVAAIRSAEGALAQANRLLDAIDNAEANIRAATTSLPALLAEVDAELRETEQLIAAGDGAPELAAAAADTRDAAAAARQTLAGAANTDLLGAFTALLAADAALDAAMAAARSRSQERRRRTELLTATLTDAAAKVTAASDFIATRRGAVGSTGRTRLAEAQRLLDEAHARVGAAQPDVSAAIDSARRAGGLADEALMSAQSDVVSWQQAESTNLASGPSTSGAVLAGVLVDSFLRGSGGGFGGFGTGGRSPGSFGGTSTSGRIGVGGRF